MKTPAERARMIEQSLGCHAYGWCSLIPFIGLALFIVALFKFRDVRVRFAGEWNPASRYLNWGMILAAIGGFKSAILCAIVLVRVLNQIE